MQIVTLVSLSLLKGRRKEVRHFTDMVLTEQTNCSYFIIIFIAFFAKKKNPNINFIFPNFSPDVLSSKIHKGLFSLVSRKKTPIWQQWQIIVLQETKFLFLPKVSMIKMIIIFYQMTVYMTEHWFTCYRFIYKPCGEEGVK